ncbi:G2H3 [Mytilus coruscus]|uniref:HECT-type E3 ubiquitin transferase n=1 Tax=Mytilus coruscus TaxID=42192 RepID=A0A6J8DCC1_MYTCO|nr:G2H3 [Mytilus coruscus]
MEMRTNFGRHMAVVLTKVNDFYYVNLYNNNPRNPGRCSLGWDEFLELTNMKEGLEQLFKQFERHQSMFEWSLNLFQMSDEFLLFRGAMDEDEALETAIQESVDEYTITSKSEERESAYGRYEQVQGRTPEEVRGIVSAWADSKISGVDRRLIVSRNTVFKSSLMYFKRDAFVKKASLLKVSFTSDEGSVEDAADAGGPRREYFRLLWQSVIESSGLVTGCRNRGYTLRPNYGAQARGEYIALGIMMATGIIQGSEAPALFVPSMVDAIVGTSTVISQVDDVVEEYYHQQLNEVENATCDNEVREAVDKNRWWEEIDGIMSRVTMDNKEEFIGVAASYLTTLRCSSMITDLKKGLETYDVLKLVIKENLRDLFEYKKVRINSSDLLALLKPRFSHDPRKKEHEELVLVNFHHFVESIQDNELETVLKEGDVILTTTMNEFIRELEPKHILVFATGSSRIPTTGFHPKPAVTFHHDNTQYFPCAVTCSNELQLFVNAANTNLYVFASNFFLVGLMNGGTFSKC